MGEILLEIKKMTKLFGPIVALNGVNLTVSRGQIHGLIGENGSGKSTITSIAAGMQQATSGEMFYKGRPWKPASMIEAQANGISMILQEANTISGCTVAENLFAGQEERFSRLGFFNTKKLNAAADALLQKFELRNIRGKDPIDRYSFEERKLVELARAITDDTEILVVDETTTALSLEGRKTLYRLMDELIAKDKGYKNVGILVFPAFAYPNQMEVAKAFMAKIDEYNATAAEPITYYQPEELMFQPLADTYLAEHPDMDCLFSVAAGAGMVYPVLVANNRTDVKLYTTGFEGTDDVTNFGSSGNGCYSGALFSAPEAIVYPLCLLIDALNGVSYADMPEEPQVVDCMPLVVISEEAMQAVVDYSMYFNADYARAVIPGEQVKNLCASYNPKATYADLVAVLATLGVDHLGK